MEVLFVLLALLFLLVFWRIVPQPDIDRPHLVSTPSARGGLTLRLVRNLLAGLFFVGVLLSAFFDPSETGTESRGAMISTFFVWIAVILMLRMPRAVAEATGTVADGNSASRGGYQLQWGDRTLTYDLRGAIERWVTRLVFLVMLAHALAVVLP